MDTCFKEDRTEDGTAYFKNMVESGLRPNLAVYNRLVDHQVRVGKIDEAKSFYDLMMKKLKMDDDSCKFMMKELSNAGRLDGMLKMVDELFDEEGVDFNEDLQEFVKGELSKEGREEDLTKLIEDKERQKAEAKARGTEEAEVAKRRAKAAVSYLLPSRFFGNKEAESESAGCNVISAESASSNNEAQGRKEDNIEEATVAESASAEVNSKQAVITGDNSDKK